MKCPTCSAPITKKFLLKFVAQNVSKMSKADLVYFLKKLSGGLRHKKRLPADTVNIKVLFGNFPKTGASDLRRASNSTQWKIFFRFANKRIDARRLIEKVCFHTDPTAAAGQNEVRAPEPNGRYEMVLPCSESQEIPVEIVFKRESGYPPSQRRMTVVFTPRFEGKGKCRSA